MVKKLDNGKGISSRQVDALLTATSLILHLMSITRNWSPFWPTEKFCFVTIKTVLTTTLSILSQRLT